MLLKKILFFANLVFLEARSHTNVELRAKVLNALRAKTEIAEIKITQSNSDKTQVLKYSLNDLDPNTLQILEPNESKSVDVNSLLNVGLNADILSYSFFNSNIPKPFGMDKKFHITFTPVKTENNSLSHYLVYYDKNNYYPVKVTYFNGNIKVTTIEYLYYKRLKDKVWRAHVITSENHLNLKRTRVEFTKIEINPESPKIKMGKNKTVNPV